MLQLVFTERAQADLLEAWLYIAEENLAAADRVLDTVEQESKVLRMQPLMGRARPDTKPKNALYGTLLLDEHGNKHP